MCTNAFLCCLPLSVEQETDGSPDSVIRFNEYVNWDQASVIRDNAFGFKFLSTATPSWWRLCGMPAGQSSLGQPAGVRSAPGSRWTRGRRHSGAPLRPATISRPLRLELLHRAPDPQLHGTQRAGGTTACLKGPRHAEPAKNRRANKT